MKQQQKRPWLKLKLRWRRFLLTLEIASKPRLG